MKRKYSILIVIYAILFLPIKCLTSCIMNSYTKTYAKYIFDSIFMYVLCKFLCVNQYLFES